MGGREAKGGGGWEAEGRLKQTHRAVLYLGHKLIQSTREAKTAVGSSFVLHAILLKPPRAMKLVFF